MVIGTPVVLNLIPGGVNKVVHVNQVNDNIEIQFQIMNGSQPYNVTEGVSCTIRGTKGDSYGYTAEAATTVGSNVVTVTLTEQLTAVAGGCNVFELVFVGAENSMKVSTENFILAVERAALGEDTVISDSDLAYAEQVLDQLQSVGAVNAQVQQNKANIAAETTRATAAEQTLQQHINSETSARQSADNTLQSNINAEASTRATQDASLQSQINQLVAPEGEAPSAAEVQNARVGADGTTYPTLGDAIRTQVTDVKTALSEDTGNVVETLSASVNVRGVTVESSKPGFINITGTATNGGGRTVPITKIVTLEPGTYTLTSNTDLPSTLSVMAEIYMVNTILATINSTTKSATFTLTSAADVYVGVNVTNGTTYNITGLLLQIKSGAKGDALPKLTATDYLARAEIDAMEDKVELIDDLSVGAYVSLKQRYTFIIGGLTQSGATSNTKNRLVSAERYTADKPVYIDMPTGYKYAIFTFVGDVATDSGWLTGINTIPKNTTFRLQLAMATENPEEVITNVETCDLYVNLTFKADTEDNYLNGIQCLSVSKMTVANPWTQGACKVGRKIVGFNASRSDHSTNAMYRVYDLDDGLTVLGGAGHNLGHCATSDYCDTTDTLLVANGTDEPGISPAIYLIKHASAKISAMSDIFVTDTDVVEIPFATITGEGTGACFGENDDIIYIITLENSAQYDVYDTKYVYRILLGKGDTDLTALYTTNSFGTFISGCGANEYNGTAYILDSHEIQMYGELQGLKYRNGYLFMSTDTPTILGTRTAYVAKIKVSDNVVVEKFYQILTLSASGGLVSCEGEGIVFDGLYGYISTSVSGVVTVYKFVTII